MTRFEFALLLFTGMCFAWLQDTIWASLVLGEVRFVSPFFMGALPAFVSLGFGFFFMYLANVVLSIFYIRMEATFSGERGLLFMVFRSIEMIVAGTMSISTLHLLLHPLGSWVVMLSRGWPEYNPLRVYLEYYRALDGYEFQTIGLLSILLSLLYVLLTLIFELRGGVEEPA